MCLTGVMQCVLFKLSLVITVGVCTSMYRYLSFVLTDTSQCVLDTLTDVSEEYIQKFTLLLRVVVDQESISGSTGFPVCITST